MTYGDTVYGMGTGLVGVAISTTGDEHRLGFLETCVEAWAAALPEGSPIFVTVDGDEDHADVVWTYVGYVAEVLRVGQPDGRSKWQPPVREGRLGVAVNKNTGLELLADAGVEHMFLSDDDTWPLSAEALSQHTGMLAHGVKHSMLCWGRHRRPVRREGYAEWQWPRGSMLYTHASVLGVVGGMVEEFGPGGHEHVEWSRRIHQAGLTPAAYCSPVSNINEASIYYHWHAEDMPRIDRVGRVEPLGNLRVRRRRLTTVRREPTDTIYIENLMKVRNGDTSYVPFRAHANSRESATLCVNPMGQGAGGEK